MTHLLATYATLPSSLALSGQALAPIIGQLSMVFMMLATNQRLHEQAVRVTLTLARLILFRCTAPDVMAERLCVVHTGTALAGCSSRWRSA